MERFQLKQFAQSASNNGIFGSYQTDNPQTSSDVDAIQSLPAWLTGWLNATTAASKLPRLEEMQGLEYVLCKAIIENYREGIPLWLSTETYYQYSVVSYFDSTNPFDIYYNTTGTHTTTNPAQDKTNWQSLSSFIVSKNGTNCVVQMPQDIQLELNNGTLTLKAGAKGYLKSGTPVITNRDVTLTNVDDGEYLLAVNQASGYMIMFLMTFYTYDTYPNNITLPIGKVTVSGGQISSIDNVFNGVGYIGSAVFVLPNVSFLLPNGRNADGSLKNIFVKTSSIQVNTSFASGNAKGEITINNLGFPVYWGYLGEFKEQPPVVQYFGYYNITDNKTYFSSTGQTWDFNSVCVVGSFVMENGVIKSIDVKNTFTALDLYQIPNLWATNTQYVSGQNPSVIVEEGDGYIKFSSGVMIQWGVSTSNPIIFPQPFINTDYSITYLSYAQVSDRTFSINNGGKTTTSVDIYLWVTGSSWQAIGRWK